MKRLFITLIITVMMAVVYGCNQAPATTPATTSPIRTEDTANEITPDTTSPDAEDITSVPVLPKTPGEWVWHNPLPNGESVLSVAPTRLNEVWGTSSTNVFAVGTDGVIVHYDGVSWRNMESGVKSNLNDIWGSSPTDIFAVGDKGAIVHYDGMKWGRMDSGTEEPLIDVSGSSATDVFAVSNEGTIFLFDGKSWRIAEFDIGQNLVCWDAWGSSSSDIFIPSRYLGDIADIFHFDGIGWLPMNSGHTYESINCIWGSSPTEVYAAAYASAEGKSNIIYYNGSQWILLLSAAETWFWDIWASSPSDIFAVGVHGTIMHYDGTEWTTMYEDESLISLRGIWGSGSEVFTVGYAGTILYYSTLSKDLISDL